MPKPWRGGGRAKASSEISPRRLVDCSRSKGVLRPGARGVGRAWAGRWLRPGDGPLRLKFGSQFLVLSSWFSVLASRFSAKSKKGACPGGLAPIFTLYIQNSRLGGVIVSGFDDLFLAWKQWVAGKR